MRSQGHFLNRSLQILAGFFMLLLAGYAGFAGFMGMALLNGGPNDNSLVSTIVFVIAEGLFIMFAWGAFIMLRGTPKADKKSSRKSSKKYDNK